jgi:hypothetical protein
MVVFLEEYKIQTCSYHVDTIFLVTPFGESRRFFNDERCSSTGFYLRRRFFSCRFVSFFSLFLAFQRERQHEITAIRR